MPPPRSGPAWVCRHSDQYSSATPYDMVLLLQASSLVQLSIDKFLTDQVPLEGEVGVGWVLFWGKFDKILHSEGLVPPLHSLEAPQLFRFLHLQYRQKVDSRVNNFR